MNKCITRSMLTDSLVFGVPIKLMFKVDNLYANLPSRVTGIALESGGETPGVAASNFMVSGRVIEGGYEFTTYVRTID